jgi:polysaccharide pyruvyl transferase WcaK-like protein
LAQLADPQEQDGPRQDGQPQDGPRQEGQPQDGPPRVLLVGYNGANNTGSESRLLSIIDEVRSVLGEDAHITVPTLNPVNLCRYIQEGPRLTVAPVPSIYFFALSRLVKEHDLVLLVEGSCYMDTWTSALLWAFLWATKVAARNGKPCMAYAVDSGHLSDANLKRVRRDASRTDLIVTRTQAAADRLVSYGVEAPIEVTADATFTYEMDPADEGILGRIWPEATSGILGISPVDFYSWPVVIRPWGRADDRYRWPYYFSRSAERTGFTRDLARGLAREADRYVDAHDAHVALICMEELDQPLAEQVKERMRHNDRVRVLSSCDYNASEMYGILRGLEFLISSRYHACVMAMSKGTPMVAIGHDLRVEDLFRDLGLHSTAFIPYTEPALFDRLRKAMRLILEDPDPHVRAIKDGFEAHVERARRNRDLLRDFVKERGLVVMV